MIRCSCLKPHPDHTFRAGAMALLCCECSHGIGLHIRQSPDDQIARLLALYNIVSWQISDGGDRTLDVTLHLTPRGSS